MTDSSGKLEIHKVSAKSEISENLAYWRSKTPEERIMAVNFLRSQYYGWKDESSQRLQRVLVVTKLKER